jgi:hypothetical protein
MSAQGAAPEGKLGGDPRGGENEGGAVIVPIKPNSRIRRALARVGLDVEMRLIGGYPLPVIVKSQRGAP